MNVSLPPVVRGPFLQHVVRRLEARPRVRAALIAAPLLLVVSLFTFTAYRGVDFGHHWDETDWQVKPVRDMVASGILMPRGSIYPAFAKWLILLPTLPAAVKEIMAPQHTARSVQAAMVAAIDAPDYLLTARRAFIVVSALAIVWVYLAALAFRRKWWEALIAASCLGLSWEYNYHSRWVATDCLAVQFSGMTLFFLAMFLRCRRAGWLYAAAVAAGLGTGAKFPAVILLFPVLLASVMSRKTYDVFGQVRRVVALCVIAVLAYLVTTPATIFDPFTFTEQLQWISEHYKNGHWTHTTANGFHHWWLVLVYLSAEYFSPYRLLSLLMFLSVFAGAVFWWRADRRASVLLIGFPIAFLCFFCFRYKAMLARNYLVTIPFLSVLSARTFGELFERVQRSWIRGTVAVLLVGAAAANAVWMVSAAETIRHIDPNADTRAAIAYIAKHPKIKFRISEKVAKLAVEQHLPMPANIVTAATSAGAFVFFAKAEGPDPYLIHTNDPWLTMAIFGPRELNFNWYSGWWGHDRILVMTLAKAKESGVALAK